MAAKDVKYDLAKAIPILERCGRAGMAMAEVAAELGVNKVTLWEWCKKEEFRPHYQWYRTLAEAYWSMQHRKVATGETKGDAKLLQHRLAAQFQEGGEWSAPNRTELTGKDGGPIETKLDESQVDARIAALLAAHPELKDTK